MSKLMLFNIKWTISWWEHVDDRGLCGRDRMVQLDLQLSMQSVPITTHVLSSNPVQMYSIQLYVMKFVIDLRQVGDFLWVLRFPLP
jgi:hypothetical protein